MKTKYLFLIFLCLGQLQAGKKIIDAIFPQVIQRGSTATFLITGHDLNGSEEVLFYKPGFTCLSIKPLNEYIDPLGKEKKVQEGKALEVIFKADNNVELGKVLFRVRTAKRLSEIMSIWVSPYNIVKEAHPGWDTDKAGNDHLERAQSVELNSTVAGFHENGTGPYANDFDTYKVSLEKDQFFTAQIINSRLGTYHYGGLTDMAMELKNSKGKTLAECNDTIQFVQDPYISIKVPESGDYYVTVKQDMDTEGTLRHYALHLANTQRPEVTYPLGGQKGSTQDLKVFYADGSIQIESVTLPKEVGHFEDSQRALHTLSPSFEELVSPNKIHVADFPNVMEEEGNKSETENAQVIAQPLPFAINGIIKKEYEKDWYQFTAKKGEKYRIRTFARTFGSKLDPMVWIKQKGDTEDKTLKRYDDSECIAFDVYASDKHYRNLERLDPVFIFEPKEDGEYLIGINDNSFQYGEDYVYRIEIEPHKDKLFAAAKASYLFPEYFRDHISLFKGQTMARTFYLKKGFGANLKGKIRFKVKGLPKGISVESPIFDENDSKVLLIFKADENIEAQTGFLELIPEYVDPDNGEILGGISGFRKATSQRNGYFMTQHHIRKIAYAVCHEAPFTLSVEQPKLDLAQNAHMKLKIKVHRTPAYQGDLEVEMTYKPLGINCLRVSIPEGESVLEYKVSASKQAKIGKHRLTMTVFDPRHVRNSIVSTYVESNAITLNVVQPYVNLKIKRSFVEQGKEGIMEAEIEHLRDFKGLASAELIRLPDRVELLEPIQFDGKTKSIQFKVKADDGALVGLHKQIACQISLLENGVRINQVAGDGMLRVDPKRGL